MWEICWNHRWSNSCFPTVMVAQYSTAVAHVVKITVFTDCPVGIWRCQLATIWIISTTIGMLFNITEWLQQALDNPIAQIMCYVTVKSQATTLINVFCEFAPTINAQHMSQWYDMKLAMQSHRILGGRHCCLKETLFLPSPNVVGTDQTGQRHNYLNN